MILASLPASCFGPLSGLGKFCYYEPVVAIVGDHPYFEVFVGMSKVLQRTQPLSCSGHKRNECRAQAALPPMMSGLDGCLRAT